MGVLRLKVLLSINNPLQCHMLTHSESTFAIVDMHRLTASILDVSNEYQNTNVPIHEIICVITPPYFLD